MDRGFKLLIVSIIQLLVFGYVAIKYDIGIITLAAMCIPTSILYDKALKQ